MYSNGKEFKGKTRKGRPYLKGKVYINKQDKNMDLEQIIVYLQVPNIFLKKEYE